MSFTNFNNETKNEIIENGDIGKNNEEIRVENQQVEEDRRANLKFQKQTKTKRNLNPTPKECSICERMASGYFFYGVICCDDINVCKSCRFDKCILKGMYIETTKGRQPEKVLEIQTMIQNKRRELASKGKYVQGKSNNCAVEEVNFVDLQKSLIAAQNKQFLDYLLTVEQNACRTRDSGIDECHYNSSYNSLASLLERKENLIAMKHMFGLQKYPEPGLPLINGFRVFSILPKPMTDMLLISVDTARTMPFFDKLDLSDKVMNNLVDLVPESFYSGKPRPRDLPTVNTRIITLSQLIIPLKRKVETIITQVNKMVPVYT
ncbi:unnamed protein product [Meloidogyne enterolobii]|uniref:Uncharacterized protein n=1 Tax=Meloidogyne enterolobii TaxID=390850 RepID=A0ACB1A4N6_MELEN